jgi:hypothetical protein
LSFNTFKVAASSFSAKMHLLMYRPYVDAKHLRFRISDLCNLYISST